jgi:hypothetical protein
LLNTNVKLDMENGSLIYYFMICAYYAYAHIPIGTAFRFYDMYYTYIHIGTAFRFTKCIGVLFIDGIGTAQRNFTILDKTNIYSKRKRRETCKFLHRKQTINYEHVVSTSRQTSLYMKIPRRSFSQPD